jgi:type IV pilus assembly protein PilN
MRISINLATRPFVELRPLFARLRLAMAGLALLALGLGIWLHFLNRSARAEQAQMDQLKAQTLALQTERARNEARMREPMNHAVLERSQFLNDLFATKSFSWTATMMDLERVLPPGVQVTSIEPAIVGEHDVNIHMRVSGERDRAVELIRNLERSQRFLSPRLANETAQTQEHGGLAPVSQVGVPGGVEFEILSGYNPLPMADKETLEKDKAAQDASTPDGDVERKKTVGPKLAGGGHISPIHGGSAPSAVPGGGR